MPGIHGEGTADLRAGGARSRAVTRYQPETVNPAPLAREVA